MELEESVSFTKCYLGWILPQELATRKEERNYVAPRHLQSWSQPCKAAVQSWDWPKGVEEVWLTHAQEKSAFLCPTARE